MRADPLANGGQASGEPGSSPATVKERMQAKLLTESGRALYARRKTIVEPVFGQIKECRGFRRFLLRGLAKIRGEWRLICLTKSAEKPRHSCRGWIGVGRAGLNAQEPNKTHAVPEPSMGEGTA